MDTVFGDGSAQEGGWMDKLFGAGEAPAHRRIDVHHRGSTKARAKDAWPSPPPPGKIVLAHCANWRRVAGAKDAFLAPLAGHVAGHRLQRRLGARLFGGEGFIPQNSKATAGNVSCMPAARLVENN